MGSTTMAATSPGGTSRLKSTGSIHSEGGTPYGACRTPGSKGPKPSWYLALDAVSETLP